MSLEFIIFILAILFGIFIYWRESKNNYLYRFANKLTHTKELQMKPSNKKGFLFEQPLILRIIYIVIFFILAFLILRFLTPINTIGLVYFTNMIVGTIVGTYIASLIVKVSDKFEDGQDIIEDTFEKGKEYLKDFTEEKKETVSEKKEVKEQEQEKSGRDRLKDKGLI